MEKTKEIAKRLFQVVKTALLSMFYMDYQVESQEPSLGIKALRLKLIGIGLAVATILWAIVFYYNLWKCISIPIGIILAIGWLGARASAMSTSQKDRWKPP